MCYLEIVPISYVDSLIFGFHCVVWVLGLYFMKRGFINAKEPVSVCYILYGIWLIWRASRVCFGLGHTFLKSLPMTLLDAASVYGHSKPRTPRARPGHNNNWTRDIQRSSLSTTAPCRHRFFILEVNSTSKSKFQNTFACFSVNILNDSSEKNSVRKYQ